MLELPECAALALQLNNSVRGHRILEAVALAAPHRFAFLTGDAASYPPRLQGRVIQGAAAHGGILEIDLGGLLLLLSDGANLRLYPAGTPPPDKHQLLLRLDGGACLVCTVQMYAGIHLWDGEGYHSAYHRAAREKPSPLEEAFTLGYFQSLAGGLPDLSVKAFLATEQRIPGLGNGTLQDILLNAGVHPRAKLSSLSGAEWEELHRAVRDTLREMTALGGRDTWKDLFGQPGKYRSLLCSQTAAWPCPRCQGPLRSENYLGGKVYYCPRCQAM
ncbi:MAG: endonuclease VIII [Christensenellales bacterium]